MGCPFQCQSDSIVFKESQPYRDKPGADDMHRCRQCGLIFPSQRLNKDESSICLERMSQLSIKELLSRQRTSISQRDNEQWTFLKKYLNFPTKAIDIGAYDGNFCEILTRMGFISYGLEAQQDVAAWAKSQGRNVFYGHSPTKFHLNYQNKVMEWFL